MAAQEPVEEQAKPDSLKLFIVAMILVSFVAVGGGWFVGSQMSSDNGHSEKDAANEQFAKKSKEDKEHAEGEETNAFSKSEKKVIELDTILVALHDSDKVWVRMELAVIATEEADIDIPEVKVRMASDITALVKTLTLAQISGPSGFVHLKEDLLDRARLTTDGQVEDLLIMSIVAE